MDIPLSPVDGVLARFTPQEAIVRDTEVSIYEFLVKGTGYPFYAWLPPHGRSLFTLQPRHPYGAPVTEGTVAGVPYVRQHGQD